MIKSPFSIYEHNVGGYVMCFTENNTVFYTHDPFEAERFSSQEKAKDEAVFLKENGKRHILSHNDKEIENKYSSFSVVRFIVDKVIQ